MDFIVAAANLKAAVYNIAGSVDRDAIQKILNTIEPTIPKFAPKGKQIRKPQVGYGRYFAPLTFCLI